MELWVFAEMIGHRRFFCGRERSLLGQHDDGDAVFVERSLRSDDKVAGGIGHAQAMQGFYGDRYYAQGFARMAEFPTCDGDHAAGLEVIEIFAEGLDGIEIIFAEREGSRRS